MNGENDVEISEKGKNTYRARSKCRYYIEMQKKKRRKQHRSQFSRNNNNNNNNNQSK